MGTLFVIAFYFFDVIRVAQNEGVVNYYSYSIAASQCDIKLVCWVQFKLLLHNYQNWAGKLITAKNYEDFLSAIFFTVENAKTGSAVNSAIPIMTTAISGSSIPAIPAPINIIVATPITNKLIPHIKLIFFISTIITPLYSPSTITPPSTKRVKCMEPFCSEGRVQKSGMSVQTV